MIEKMKFLSITGPKEDIDRVIDTYLSKYEIHLENALSELKTVKDLRPYIETNPYKDAYQRAMELAELLPPGIQPGNRKKIPIQRADKIVSEIGDQVKELTAKEEALISEQNSFRQSLERILPFTGLNYELSSILQFKYIKFRFGRISHEYYNKFVSYVYDTIDTVLYKCREDDEYVWLVYFVPESISNQIDAIYASMRFERYFLPDVYEGTPLDAIHFLEDKISALQSDIDGIRKQMSELLESRQEELLTARDKLEVFSTNFNVRKLAACTKQKVNTFYILCGWMSNRDAAAFQKEISNDEKTFCILEDDHNNILSKPPTKLHNPRLFKPFEMFIQMYGLPAYNEIDPTILIGITYSFLFGFMFGDVGQGICLLIGGLLLYRLKKINLAAIISCCGIFSTIFGFLFGSVFGFENIIQAVWLRPLEHMTNLPFIGRLNTVFIVAVSIGMGIILLTMVLNIINSIRFHDPERTLFDTNGVAGLVFYASLVLTIVLYMTNNPIPAAILLVIMFGLPLIVMFFKEPLTNLVEKKAQIMPKEKGMFVVQGFFELFEVLLSYFSNTLSFVRVGAFAVSHAAMMEVVLMLSGVEAGNPNWLVVILGNLFVCGMEGLIVGIQVLRLEYYELFSRFYRGTGRAFKPYGKKI
ncbi:V-type ATP synthase subunit I [Lacrimispora sphenoides]|uniref:V/A-type H+-transporting ATPase subunit I n=1 Tax=Lacrimispora sphenoides JCM 1415 TaxID=1297793 RepID=A0ABY1CGC4_9FIRM|nr:V-type ATPase 116kDa subunit family protein [Lacrimispora sphenoides]SEU01092.1 V/A-type H+-transporting ATPase subunit I [[Clostridium] sphenoides JCM 1415]SUY53224.1 V-type ATPase 116 kDa subunit [Lacrimispora sphenoides]